MFNMNRNGNSWALNLGWVSQNGWKVIATEGVAVMSVILGIAACGPSESHTTTKQGITYEEDGTALTGRESGEGWLDLKCKSGEVVVRVVNDYAWEIVDEGSFPDDACDDNKLKPGELSMGDIPENLRG